MLVVLLALVGAPRTSRASEAAVGEAPAPTTVEEVAGETAKAWVEPVRERALFPRLKQALRELPPFFRDAEIGIRPRTYYLYADDDIDGETRAAWAIGGSIDVRSGWWRDTLRVEAEFFSSNRLTGDKDRGGTELLKPVQRSFHKLGQANLKLRRGDHKLTLYRQRIDLPYVNGNDSRMVPNTFEGYSFESVGPTLSAGAGYLTRIKRRDSDRFIPMSEAAGVDAKRGMAAVGARYTPAETIAAGVFNYYVPDVLNILYAEAEWRTRIAKRVDVKLGAQFTDQRSVGDDLLTGSAFDTRVGGARLAVGYRGGIAQAAFSITSDEERIRSPYGAYPGYVSLMQRDFNRAGELAWLLGFTYDLARLGLPGVTIFTSYAAGVSAEDPLTGASLPDEHEFDLTLDIRPREGVLRGFWLRLRGSTVEQDGASGSSRQFRVVLNYDFSAL
ncbi:MAG: OprD family outer membrane porin [Deltaproteobacteria bacterium]|nr:MAG: OprD family outer membrane porin [Deltaproteobacteria bacterium]